MSTDEAEGGGRREREIEEGNGVALPLFLRCTLIGRRHAAGGNGGRPSMMLKSGQWFAVVREQLSEGA